MVPVTFFLKKLLFVWERLLFCDDKGYVRDVCNGGFCGVIDMLK